MTETEWLTASDPGPMLAYVRGTASERKLRLFAAACCRQATAALLGEEADESPGAGPRLLPHERRVVGEAARGVDTAERYADREAGQSDAVAAYIALLRRLSGQRPERQPWAFVLVAALRAVWTGACFYGQDWEVDQFDAWSCARDAAGFARQAALGTDAASGKVWADLLRDIFGNPFRPARADPGWVTATAVGLAEAIYAERAFDRLPVLADALEEAGCENPDVLNHCRAGGVHVRGCWVVDLVLGRA